MFRKLLAITALGMLVAVPSVVSAQGQRAIESGPGMEFPKTLKGAAAVDLAGTWVSVVTEDWRWRMMTPPRGDYAAIPLNAEGRRVADLWDPVADEAMGLQCRLFGAGSIMRLPGRFTFSWADDDTLKIDIDAGTQTRLIHNIVNAKPPAGAEKTWQGHSVGGWEIPEGALGKGEGNTYRATSAQLKVTTSGFRSGYVRRNGVPYSENAQITEYYVVVKADNNDQWLVVTTIIDDPTYMNELFTTSTHYKKERDNSKFSPTSCVAYKEVIIPGAVR